MFHHFSRVKVVHTLKLSFFSVVSDYLCNMFVLLAAICCHCSSGDERGPSAPSHMVWMREELWDNTHDWRQETEGCEGLRWDSKHEQLPCFGAFRCNDNYCYYFLWMLILPPTCVTSRWGKGRSVQMGSRYKIKCFIFIKNILVYMVWNWKSRTRMYQKLMYHI